MKKLISTLLISIVLALPFVAGQQKVPQHIFVPVHLHVHPECLATNAQLDEQINVLNREYGRATPFQFQRVSEDADPILIGGKNSLNLYAVSLTTLFGFEYIGVLGVNVDERVLIDCDTLPGGKWPRYNKGFTAVHEVGHWLGLSHEQGTCAVGRCNWMDNDVDDTYKGVSFNKGQTDLMINTAMKDRGFKLF